MYKLLIIEDDSLLLQTLSECFDSRLYHTIVCQNGLEAYKIARNGSFDLIVTDWILPGKSGTDIIKQLRLNNIDTPILIISSKNHVEDIVTGLKTGSDGYLCKPFNLLEFKTRVETMLKRPSHKKLADICYGPISINKNKCKVFVNTIDCKLRKKEFLILKLLLENPEITFSREQIVSNVWNFDSEPYEGSVDVHMSRLRSKIDKPFGTNYIKTVHGFGYKLLK